MPDDPATDRPVRDHTYGAFDLGSRVVVQVVAGPSAGGQVGLGGGRIRRRGSRSARHDTSTQATRPDPGLGMQAGTDRVSLARSPLKA